MTTIAHNSLYDANPNCWRPSWSLAERERAVRARAQGRQTERFSSLEMPCIFASSTPLLDVFKTGNFKF